jgi:hypothetical protein
MHIKNKKQILTTILSVLVSVFLVAAVVFATTTVGNDVTVGGALSVNDGITVTRSLSSQTTENNANVLSLTTDSSFLSGTNMTWSSSYGSAALKLVGAYSGTTGGYSNIYSTVTNSGAIGTDGAGVVGVKSVAVNTAAMTDGEIYGGIFIAKHNHATNVMTASASLIGLEGWGYDSGAAPARTVIGGNFGYHNEGTTAKGDGSVYRGVQIFTDDSQEEPATDADERTSLALWNMAGTQTNGIKFIKSDGGWTTDITLQNGATIANPSSGIVTINGNDTAAPNNLVNIYGNLKIVNATTTVVTGTDPGAQVKLQYEASGIIAADKQLQGIQVSATAGNVASLGGVTGGEFKARAKTGIPTATLNQLRGVMAEADVKNRTVNTMYGLEAKVSSNESGATVASSAVALQVTQGLGAQTTVSGASIYGISIKAENMANTADIQLSGGSGNQTVRPTIMSGSGAPGNGLCVTGNLGSIYLDSTGGSDNTIYVCVANNDWDTVDTSN